MYFSSIKTSHKILAAFGFGGGYWVLIGLTPLGYAFEGVDCWDLGAEPFLFGRDQLVLSVCAAISFLAISFLTISGWKGVLKTIAVTYFCFQIYTVFAVQDYIFHYQCFFPLRITEIPAEYYPGLILSRMVLAGYWTVIYLIPLAIVGRVMAARKSLES
ncbi:MAG TPA: hypothetical protein VHQ01_13065 [Pyrinomonadaceae bacterium]|jgi:hypothetical protein|nr:hypothetical protein [Pyrinomonadaceae bacterium]